MNITESVFTTSYTSTEEGALVLVVATLERGEVFRMTLGPEEALNNLLAFAATMGLLVVSP